MMKKPDKERVLKWIPAVLTAVMIFVESGYIFFDTFISVRSRKPKNLKKVKRKDIPEKKRFQLRMMKINHPRSCGFEKEYLAGKMWCFQQDMQDLYIKSEDGLRLHAAWFPAEDAKRTLVLSHGYKGTSFGEFGFNARFLHECGCNLLFVDQRCCGESEGRYITFGAKEQKDIVRWSREAVKLGNGHALPVYLYGESMGASAVLMASGRNLPKEVKGIISDCGFVSMKSQLSDLARYWFFLRWIPLHLLLVDLFCRAIADFGMAEADTRPALAANRRPVLLFHGSDDTFVYPKNLQMICDACRGPKEMVMVEGARHTGSAYKQTDMYRRKLLDFFERYDAS